MNEQSKLDYVQFEFTPRQRKMVLELAESARQELREQREQALDEERYFRPPLAAIDLLLNDVSKFIYHAEDSQYRKISLRKTLLIILLFELMKQLNRTTENLSPALQAVRDEKLNLFYFLGFDFLYHFTMQEYHGFIDQFRPVEEIARIEQWPRQYINTAGMNEVAVFTALYNAAKPQGHGFIQDDARNITENEGAELYHPNPSATERTAEPQDSINSDFDYVKGRLMKVSRHEIESGYIDVTIYDEYNGAGTAQKAVEHLPRI